MMMRGLGVALKLCGRWGTRSMANGWMCTWVMFVVVVVVDVDTSGSWACRSSIDLKHGLMSTRGKRIVVPS